MSVKLDMIDLHTHVVYGLDDGASTLEESIAMLKRAHAFGTKIVVATPHDSPEGRFQLDHSKFDRHLTRIKNRLIEEQIPIQVLKGSEFKLNSRSLDAILAKKVQTINNTNVVLVECTLASVQHSYVNSCLDELCAQGMIPLMAHVERYFQSLEEALIQVKVWIAQGIYIQVNRESLLPSAPRKLRKLALHLIKEGCVHVIASDAHHLEPPRDIRLDDSFNIIKRYFNLETAQRLHYTNPNDILEQRPLSSPTAYVKPSLVFYGYQLVSY